MANPNRIFVPLTVGHNSKRDPGMVGFGGLVRSQGGEYLVGDTEFIHKIPGRTIYDDVGGSRIKGLQLANYDDGTSYLLALSGTQIFYGDASLSTVSMTQLSIPEGARKNATARMTAAHFDNSWYVATGKDESVVIEADATVITHGMRPHFKGTTTVTTLGPGSVNSALSINTTSGTWFELNNVPSGGLYGQLFGAFSGAEVTESDGVSITYEETTTLSYSNRQVEFTYGFGTILFGSNESDPSRETSDFGDTEAEFQCLVTVSYATDGGTTYTDWANHTFTRSQELVHAAIPIGAAVASDDIRVRIEATASQVDGVNTPILRIWNVRMHNGNSATTYTNTTGKLFYAFSEYDAKRGLESALSPPGFIDQDVAYSIAQLTLPSTARNSNATHFKIYRTSNQNPDLDRSEFGQVGMVKVGDTSFLDTFQLWRPYEAVTVQAYPWLILREYGVPLTYESQSPPPALEFLGHFGGALFGLKNRSYYQSIPGKPHSWPAIFNISRFPFAEHSPLYAAHQVDDVLWIGGQAGCCILDHPIHTSGGSLRMPSPRPLGGAPGVTGPYAACTLELDGEPLVAWVSPHGVYISNLTTYRRVTDALDWEATVEESLLSNAVLAYSEKKQQLVLHYTKNGSSLNDAFMLIHLAAEHRDAKKNPLITLDHPGDFFCRTDGVVGGVYKEFTGNHSSGEIYLEGGSATADESQSHTATDDIPFDVQTGRQYSSADVEVTRLGLYHGAVAATITSTFTIDTGRDDDTLQAYGDTISVPFYGTRGRWRYFNALQAGDYMQFRIQHTGQTAFKIGPIQAYGRLQREQGEVE